MKKKLSQLPKYVYPAGVAYKVMHVSLEEKDHGECCSRTREIKINKDIKVTPSLDSVLFHEYLHALFGCTGLSELLENYNDNLEEALVMCLEAHLFRHINIKSLGSRE